MRLKEIYKEYDSLNFFYLLRDLIVAKLFLGNYIRKVRLPYFIIGKRYIQFGEKFTAGINLRIEALLQSHLPKPAIRFGTNNKLNDYVHIACILRVTFGDNILVGSNVIITDHDHGSYGGRLGTMHDDPLIPPDERKLIAAPVTIEDNVWIGDFVAVLKGSHIGKGSIIGAMSVVNGIIPPYSIAVGSPAKVVKKYNFETKCWEKA